MTIKKIIFLFFLGIVSSFNHRIIASWDVEPYITTTENTFSFTRDDGDKITIYKSQSYCEPLEEVYIRNSKYGTPYKKFSIRPRCVFKGIQTTYAGLSYVWEKEEDCNRNKFLCKAAGHFNLLNNYWSERKILEQKIQKEINEFNKDFKSKDSLAKILFEEEQKKERIKNYLESVNNARSECYKVITQGYRESKINNQCSRYIYYEQNLLNEGVKLPYISYASWIPSKYMTHERWQTNFKYIDPGKIYLLGISYLTNSEHLTIENVFKNSPASSAGIKPNDQIIQINGMSTKGLTREEAAILLGSEDSDENKIINLTLIRKKRGGTEKFNVRLVKDILNIYDIYPELENKPAQNLKIGQ